jgi:hypothetical protein
MILYKKIIAVIVMFFTILFVHSPHLYAQNALEGNDTITQNEPEMMATPEETIPVETVERKMSKWEWVLLGALAVGALAAAGAAAGGGGDDGGTVSEQPAGDSGNVEVSW